MQVRLAKIDDSSALVQLLKEGARDGHFAKNVERQADKLVQEVLLNGEILMQLRRGGTSLAKLPATIYVAEQNGCVAAFLFCLFHPESALELHLTATRKEMRRQGCSRALVRFAMEQKPDAQMVFARCYKKSTFAIKHLHSEGFCAAAVDGDPIELTLRR